MTVMIETDTMGFTGRADAGGLDSFVLPMMLGSIGELRPMQFQTPGKHYAASITLIARRSTQRIGTRHWRRGADTQACHLNMHCHSSISSISSVCMGILKAVVPARLAAGISAAAAAVVVVEVLLQPVLLLLLLTMSVSVPTYASNTL